MSIASTLTAIATELRGVGEWEVHDITPASVNVPAVFPGAVEQVVTDEQDGSRSLTSPWWVVVASSAPEHQRWLYDAVERVWGVLESPETPLPNAAVARVDSVGVVNVGGDDLWGARVVIEVAL